MTDPHILIPFLIFGILMTGTPGPNNAMALASGVKAGFWPSMPLVLGIALGVGLQLVAVGLGLAAVFKTFPPLHDLLRIGGAAYMLWLAFKIARSGPFDPGKNERPPLGFAGGVVFQWINPKAWAITVSAAATYVPPAQYALNVAIAAALIAAIAVPCVSIWVAGGTALRRFLVRPGFARMFNLAVALLLVAVVIPILFGE